MNKTEKMSLALNLAKRVRLQQTNQARLDPIYDASLYVFAHNDVNEATGKTFPKIKNNSRTKFPAPRTIVSRNFYFFLRMLRLHTPIRRFI